MWYRQTWSSTSVSDKKNLIDKELTGEVVSNKYAEIYIDVKFSEGWIQDRRTVNHDRYKSKRYVSIQYE